MRFTNANVLRSLLFRAIRVGHDACTAGTAAVSAGTQCWNVDLRLRVMLMGRRGGREVRRFIEAGHMGDRYMRMVKLLRWIGNRLRERLLKI